MENHHAINGKIHYFDWAIFNSYVSSPEGTSMILSEPVSLKIPEPIQAQVWGILRRFSSKVYLHRPQDDIPGRTMIRFWHILDAFWASWLLNISPTGKFIKFWPVNKFLDGCRSKFIEVSQANGALTPSNLLPNMTHTLKHSIDFEQMAIQMNSKPYLSEGRTSHVPWWIKFLLDDHLAPYLPHLQRWVFQIFRGPSTLKPIIVKLIRHFSWSWYRVVPHS